ncbi:hypothetical protein PR048_005053 [Dryococelus australis]|uniref:Uncharacterized protein n=1 Tax=Dryococelus australis TaxID=614101 RepID=A0ABQ9I746_9NEOP|nr:hypothetical protein PR048_005053 [Dryococelus australis]
MTSWVYKLNKQTLLVNLCALGIEAAQSHDIDTLQKKVAARFKEKSAGSVHRQSSRVGAIADFKRTKLIKRNMGEKTSGSKNYETIALLGKNKTSKAESLMVDLFIKE